MDLNSETSTQLPPKTVVKKLMRLSDDVNSDNMKDALLSPQSVELTLNASATATHHPAHTNGQASSGPTKHK